MFCFTNFMILYICSSWMTTDNSSKFLAYLSHCIYIYINLQLNIYIYENTSPFNALRYWALGQQNQVKYKDLMYTGNGLQLLFGSLFWFNFFSCAMICFSWLSFFNHKDFLYIREHDFSVRHVPMVSSYSPIYKRDLKQIFIWKFERNASYSQKYRLQQPWIKPKDKKVRSISFKLCISINFNTSEAYLWIKPKDKRYS